MVKLVTVVVFNFLLAGVKLAPFMTALQIAFGSFIPVHRIQNLGVDYKPLQRQRSQVTCYVLPER